MESLLQLFPADRRAFWEPTALRGNRIQEIRIRVDRPVMVLTGRSEYFLDRRGNWQDSPLGAYCATGEELRTLLCCICHDSLYAYEDELRQGFLTVPGGHRVGVAGQVVLEAGGGIRTIKHISFLNIRIAHELRGAADKVLPSLYRGGSLQNTLIVSPPGCGKTTLLRDLIRQISDGNAYHPGLRVGVVDERSEIAGSYLGRPQNDLGMRTDILDACPKAQGMLLLLRSMAPQVIAVDELGGEEDTRALELAASCGSRLLATVHGEGLADMEHRMKTSVLYGLFERILVLGKKHGQPVVREIWKKEEKQNALTGGEHDHSRMYGSGTLVSPSIDGTPGGTAKPDPNSGAMDE